MPTCTSNNASDFVLNLTKLNSFLKSVAQRGEEELIASKRNENEKTETKKDKQKKKRIRNGNRLSLFLN